MKKIAFLILMSFLLLSCVGMKTYTKQYPEWDDWLNSCKNWRDVDRWLAMHFRYDHSALRDGTGGHGVWETYRTGTGVCTDAADFVKYSLEEINGELYKPDKVWVDRGKRVTGHQVCAFWLDGKIYIMDYGSARKPGATYGPYDNLDQWASWYTNGSYVRVSFITRDYPEVNTFSLEKIR